MATGLYLSRFTVAASQWTFDATVDAVNVTNMAIPAGNYYLDSPTASESLVSAIDTLLEANFPGENFTVTLDRDTGKITFACQTLAGTWAIAIDQQSFADAIGWGATLGFGLVAGATQTGPEIAQYLIIPGSGRQNYRGPASDVPNEGHRATSGVTAGVGSATELIDTSWLHGFERYVADTSPLQSGTKDNAGTVRPWTWADFFKHHRQTHHAFRYYDGSPVGAIGSYERASTAPLGYKLAGKSLGKFDPDTFEPNNWYYFQVPLEVCEAKAGT